MLGFIKKSFFTGLEFLSTLKSVNMLSCISINNQGCKVMGMILSLFILVLKQVNTGVVATISIIYAQNCVFLML